MYRHYKQVIREFDEFAGVGHIDRPTERAALANICFGDLEELIYGSPLGETARRTAESV